MFRFSVVFFNSQTTIFLVPILVSSSGYQGWISLIGGCCLGLVLLFFTMKLGSLKTDQAWVDFGKAIMGKWVHKLLVLLLLCWCVYYSSYDIENFVLFFGSNYMRGTPPLFIQIVIGLVIMYTASLGLATIVYMTDGIFLIILVATIFTLYLFTPNADFTMLPAFIHHFDPGLALKDTLTVTSWFSEWVVFLFVAPELKINGKMLKKLMVAQLCITFTVLMGWIFTILNFGPHLGKELRYPFLEMVRSSSHDSIIGNMDPILIGLWSFSMFIHSAFLIYVAYKCALHLLNRKGKKYVIPVLTVCSITLAYLYSRNITKYFSDFSSAAAVIFWLVVECIPVYYIAVAYVRSKINAAPK
ncbi:GerAB/ArcD/ProY family transporter [Paenibacillus sp. PK3_47]|uniref:GerAB/ArcD/ProY family transporter n=1 Tax=Paenibacillus sp. PK3_47 TaxID=2072642 RepID=UPI00201E70B2|nr:GerAB/ArcD/ProY family transporter [Paenibacillus sp. PK3_47]